MEKIVSEISITGYLIALLLILISTIVLRVNRGKRKNQPVQRIMMLLFFCALGYIAFRTFSLLFNF